MRKHTVTGIFAIITVALILQTGGAMAGGASNAAKASNAANEYELMSLLIREQYGSDFSLILIGRDTEVWCLSENLGFLKQTWPNLKSETIDSLIVRNSGEPQRLTESFNLPVEYRLMSEDEYLKILGIDRDASGKGTLAAGADGAVGMEAYSSINGAAEPDWDHFDERFPDAPGYLIFSRVAFDSACTQALVIFANAYRCSGVSTRPQSREIACFGKKDGAWVLVGTSRTIKAMD